ncbi:unnamed protein product [Gongylonema pulchrum]|uniref:Occludin_ELL domain-containing protein n=1 Tax=Gongylonema pulchrum TaxID=637853 RepID=A0A183D0I9_9BILA|nr:unnamed protein product [Gongylonema pulchrum]
MEEAIKARYEHYQRSSEYRETRQKHEDLRAKLKVLKNHVEGWSSPKQEQHTDQEAGPSCSLSSKSNDHSGRKNAAAPTV